MIVDGFLSSAMNIQVAEEPSLPMPSSADSTKYFQRRYGSPDGSSPWHPGLSSASFVPQKTCFRATDLVGGSNTSRVAGAASRMAAAGRSIAVADSMRISVIVFFAARGTFAAARFFGRPTPTRGPSIRPLAAHARELV